MSKIKFIDKSGNIQFLDASKEPLFMERLEMIWSVYFEKREEEKVVKAKKAEKVEDLDYKKILKENGVKGAHLYKDEEKAKEKCIELWLLA